jgi:DNA polymerase III subunit beta
LKISCSRRELHEALQTVSRAVSGRSTLPILSNLLIRAEGASVTLVATDLELGITYTVGAAVSEPGSLTVPAKLITDLVAQLPEATVTLAVDDRHTAVLTCEQAEYHLLGLPPAEFPSLPAVRDETTFDLPQAILRRMIRSVAIATDNDDIRPTLTGIYCSVAGNRLRMAATDLFKLAVRSCEISPVMEERTVIIPARAATETMRVLDTHAEEPVRVRLDANQIAFATDRVTILSRLIEGQFPRFERFLTADRPKRVLIPLARFQQAVRRAELVARENSHRILLRTEGEYLTLSAQAGDLGRAYETLEVAREGDDFEFAANARNLLDVMSVLESEGLYLEVGEPRSGAVIRPVDDKDFVFVTAPMNVQ